MPSTKAAGLYALDFPASPVIGKGVGVGAMPEELEDVVVVAYRTARVHDAGGQVLISGPVEADVREALDMLVNDDKAQLISLPAKLGGSWLAACTHPARERIPCRLERDGLTVVVVGPTKEAVTVEVLNLMQSGAALIDFPWEARGEWTAVLDIGDLDDTGAFNWSDRAYRR